MSNIRKSNVSAAVSSRGWVKTHVRDGRIVSEHFRSSDAIKSAKSLARSPIRKRVVGQSVNSSNLKSEVTIGANKALKENAKLINEINEKYNIFKDA